jgi:hypothetical protein
VSNLERRIERLEAADTASANDDIDRVMYVHAGTVMEMTPVEWCAYRAAHPEVETISVMEIVEV